jgi:8-oxo-dGTP pyrophosphatase MutT (NUDIX family)
VLIQFQVVREARAVPFDVWEVTASTLAVVTSLIAVSVFIASTGAGSGYLIRRVLTGARRRTVVKVLAKHGVCTRGAAVRAANDLAHGLVAGKHHDANAELEWLARLQDNGLPFTFIVGDDKDRRTQLGELAAAYELMAGKWRSRLVFGTRASELVASLAKVADETSTILGVHATNAVVVGAAGDAIDIDLRARGHFAQVLYSSWNLDLAVSPHPNRLASVPGQLVGGGTQPRFDGILPHLLDQQLELDQQSGRHRLHLAIAEMPYSQLLARNIPWDVLEQPVTSLTHAVSLALLPVTSDGFTLLARRSDQAGAYPGMIGPYVTGNAELRDRMGLRADRDSFGLPDLLAAICREAREEVGLRLVPEQLRLLGLARIWSPEDTGIWCLMTTASLTITKEEAAELVRFGDHVEGSWEVGAELLALDLWRPPGAHRDVLRWAASADLVPQAVASLLALVRKSGCDVSIDWRAAASSPTVLTESVLQPVSLRHPFR